MAKSVLLFPIVAVDQYSKEFKKFDQAGGKVGSKFGSALAGGAKAGLAAIALGLGALVVDTTKKFSEFDSGMRQVWTNLPDMSAAAFEKMKQDVLDFSAEMGVATDIVVPALYEAIGAGIPAANVFSFMTTATKASIGGFTDLTTAVNGITNVTNAYGLENISAAEASDDLFASVNVGKQSFEELATEISGVTPTAVALGIAFGDVAAAIGALTAIGTPTSEAVTQIRSAIAEMGKSGTLAATVFESVAGSTFPEFIASGGNLEDAFGLMAKAAKEQGKSVLDMFSSIEGGSAASALTSSAGAEKFSDAMSLMGNSSGLTEQAFEKANSGIGRKWDTLLNQMQIKALEFADFVSPALSSVIDGLEGLGDQGSQMEGIGTWFETTGASLAEDVGGSTWLDTAKTAVSTTWDVLSDIGESFKTWFSEHAEGFQAFGDKFNTLWEAISENLSMAGDLWSGVFDFLKGAWDRFGPAIITGLQTMFEGVVLVVGGIVDVITGVINIVTGLATFDFGRVWEGIKQLFAGIGNMIAGLLTMALAPFAAFVQAIWAMFHNVWDTVWESTVFVWNAIVGFFVMIGSAIVDFFVMVGEGIATAWNATWDAVMTAVQAVGDFFVMIGQWFVDVWNGAIEGITAAVEWFADLKDKFTEWLSGVITAVSEKIQDLLEWFAGLPADITAALGELGSLLMSKGTELISGLRSGVKTAFESVKTWFGDIGTKVKDAIGDMASTLLGAGKAVIQGFIDGVKAKFNDVKSTLGDLTSSLTSWKGPMTLDMVILGPSGEAVIDGFIDGLQKRIPGVKAVLTGLTSDLPSMTAGAATAAAAGVMSAPGVAPLGPAASSGSTINIKEVHLHVVGGGAPTLDQIEAELFKRGIG